MGWWNRLRRVISSNLNSAISKAEDPEKMLDQIVIDLQKQMADARKQVASAMADERRLSKQVENENKLKAEWEAKAQEALRQKREDLAQKAMKEAMEHEKLAAEYDKQWTQQKAAVDKLRTALTEMGNKVEEARRKKNLLIAKSKRAKAQKSIQDTISGMGDSDAMSAFDRMEHKVDQMEAEAEVSGELAESGDPSLNDEFKGLEDSKANQDADQRLLEMKRKMGMLPADSKKTKSLPETGKDNT